MILLKEDMFDAQNRGDIYFTYKLTEENTNPNSINVTLDRTLKMYTPFKLKKTKQGLMIIKTEEVILDVKKKNKVYEVEIPEEGLILSPDMFYLGNTVEKAGSDRYIPMYEGRSSLARLGLVSHLSAGFGDVGFKSQWTLEIAVKEPLKIYPNMRIGQVYFVKGSSDYPKYMYDGKYNGQTGPQESKMYKDYLKEDKDLLLSEIEEVKEKILQALPEEPTILYNLENELKVLKTTLNELEKKRNV